MLLEVRHGIFAWGSNGPFPVFAGWVVYSYHISLMSWHEPLHGFSPNQYIVQLFVKNSKFGTFIQYGKCLFFQAAKALKTKRNPCPSIQAPIFPEKKEEKLAYFASPPLFSRDGNAGACDASISILEGGNVWEELEVISGMSRPRRGERRPSRIQHTNV